MRQLALLFLSEHCFPTFPQQSSPAGELGALKGVFISLMMLGTSWYLKAEPQPTLSVWWHHSQPEYKLIFSIL